MGHPRTVTLEGAFDRAHDIACMLSFCEIHEKAMLAVNETAGDLARFIGEHCVRVDADGTIFEISRARELLLDALLSQSRAANPTWPH